MRERREGSALYRGGEKANRCASMLSQGSSSLRPGSPAVRSASFGKINIGEKKNPDLATESCNAAEEVRAIKPSI